MRCPKCGFISFDHLETCKKCHKPLADVASELNGTVVEARPPRFLDIDWPGSAAAGASSDQPVADQEETATSFAFEDIAFAEQPNTETSLDIELTPEPERGGIEMTGSEEELVIALDDLPEVAPRNEFTLDLNDQADAEAPAMPSLDFGDLDISDLAPPVQQAAPITFAEKPAISELETVAAPPPQAPARETKVPAAGLEDLHFDGLDLDTPARLTTEPITDKKGVVPSVKTGTALDKFDIDLGELFSEAKK